MTTITEMKSISLHSRIATCFAMFLVAMLPTLHAKAKKDKDPMLRIACVATIPGHQEYIIASPAKKGKWEEHHALTLRPSLISSWIPVPRETLHVCVREDGNLVSKGSFTYPDGARRALVVLLPGETDDAFKFEVIDTAKPAFRKGEILLINSSTHPASVKLGEREVEAKAGESSVHKPKLDDKGMYHLLVTYTNQDGEIVTCSDSYLPGNDTGRDLLILVPDAQLGIRLATLAEFGPFE